MAHDEWANFLYSEMTMTQNFDINIIAVIASLLVGGMTAIFSYVKLINDKEQKTTDFRQAWTDSVRKDLSALISSLSSYEY